MSETVILNSFFGWQGACLCTVFERGGNFTTLIEESDVAYFPAVQNGHEARFLVGSVPRLSGCVATALLSTLPPCGSNIFGPGDGLDHDHVDHDLCRIVGLVYPGCVENQLPSDMPPPFE